MKIVHFSLILRGTNMNKLTYDKSTITKEALESLRCQRLTYAQISEHFGVTQSTIKRACIDYGIIPNPKRHAKKFLDVSPEYIASRADEFQKFLVLHKQGMTFTEIANTCNRSLSYVGKLFRLNGYSFDSTYKTKAAHEAVKGKKRTLEDLERRAKGKETHPPKMSRWESWFANWLTSQSISYIYSKAVGKYNIDFAIGDSIAVELYGGAFHSDGRAAARLNDRMRYLLNSGWNVYIIWCLSQESCIFSGCLNDFVSFMETSSRNESSKGQYRVIWSDGDFVSAGSDEVDYRAVVFPATMRHNALSKYKSSTD